ncbi:MAG TPA: hypothetical protein PKH65_02635 [Bacteroidia bacterium]|nr:hypothetical protein [Bacteroidia bacterium]HNT79553.1 hypothetical protein [Bacteroidia bacterium]
MKENSQQNEKSIDPYSKLGEVCHFFENESNEKIEAVNDKGLDLFVRKWAIRAGFLPVIRYFGKSQDKSKNRYVIDKNKNTYISEYCFMRLYFSKSSYAPHHDERELPDILHGYAKFMSKKVELSLNYMHITLDYFPTEAEIMKCKTMKELEELILVEKNYNSLILVNRDYPNEGASYTSGFGFRSDSDFMRCNQLILNGYFEPQYELDTRKKYKEEVLGISRQKETFRHTHAVSKRVSLFKTMMSFMDEDTLLYFNAEYYFNRSFPWADRYGVFCVIESYNENTLTFKLITDPRWITRYKELSLFVFMTYINCIDKFKDIENYVCNHYLANDIIGYNYDKVKTTKHSAYDVRINTSLSTLKPKPDDIYTGSIDQFTGWHEVFLFW